MKPSSHKIQYTLKKFFKKIPKYLNSIQDVMKEYHYEELNKQLYGSKKN